MRAPQFCVLITTFKAPRWLRPLSVSTAVVLLLLIHCLMFLPLFVGVLCLVLVFVLHYLVSFQVLQSS